LVTTPDFVACHVPAYINLYDVLKGLKKGGSFLLNSIWDKEETKKRLPDHMKKYLAVMRSISILSTGPNWAKSLAWATAPIPLCRRHSLKLPV
jgi:hypothetical protein